VLPIPVGENLLGFCRSGLDDERRDVQMRGGCSPFEQQLVRRVDSDLEPLFLDGWHVLTMAVQ
jgi:hypothetical protein